jgi:hypothetical protein
MSGSRKIGKSFQYKGFLVAGHSKWANIQHRKGRQDEKRGKIWTRITREIIVSARLGGGDLSLNPRLRLAIEKAKAALTSKTPVKIEMPIRNINRAVGAILSSEVFWRLLSVTAILLTTARSCSKLSAMLLMEGLDVSFTLTGDSIVGTAAG